MRFKSLLARRPSPAVAISTVALFLSLAGVGWAATQLPPNSVGTAQIQNQAVTYRKIRPSSVGIVRANTSQLQVRVNGTCAAGSAIGAIDRAGHVTCNQTLPQQYGTTDNTASEVGATAVTVTSVALPTGSSYLAFANPTATVTPASGVTTSQHVTVTCKLTVGSNTETRSVTIDTTGVAGQSSIASIPLQEAGQSGTGSVSCTSSVAPLSGVQTQPAAPSVSVTSAIDAFQVQ
ncbi:MAG TPA: hypothetical protein VKV27_08815 [Solirubrobacteraceae bacterium]|nr:hypothetical protein [Solirubrobacteraceae bacterium]